MSEIKIPPSTKGRFPFLMAIAVLVCGIGIGFFIGRVSAPQTVAPQQSNTSPSQPMPMGPPPGGGPPAGG